MRCKALQRFANPLYLSRFIFYGLPGVAGYCVRGGVRDPPYGAHAFGLLSWCWLGSTSTNMWHCVPQNALLLGLLGIAPEPPAYSKLTDP